MIYLDSAATTLQKPPAVARAMAQAVNRLASPGRGGHAPAMAAAETAFRCRQAAAELAQIAGLQVEAYATEMFAAGSNLKSKTDEEIFYQDFKRFTAGRVSFGVGQISSLNQQELEQLKTRMLPYLQKARQAHGVSMIFFMLTNILTESTVLLCEGAGAGQMILEAFHMENDEAAEKQAKDGVVYLQGVVSRKKQLVPAIAMALQE